jgi:protein gp37
MADTSKIEWTDATWNIITGCTLVDEGCRHCYAAHLITSWPAIGNHPSRKGLARKNAAGVSKFTGEVRFNEDWLDQPLRWKKPRKIFVCAHGDLFHETVPDEWIDHVFAVMALAPQHTFQVLTKRPERARAYLNGDGLEMGDASRGANIACIAQDDFHRHLHGSTFFTPIGNEEEPQAVLTTWPLPNVWLGTSISDQASVLAINARMLWCRSCSNSGASGCPSTKPRWEPTTPITILRPRLTQRHPVAANMTACALRRMAHPIRQGPHTNTTALPRGHLQAKAICNASRSANPALAACWMASNTTDSRRSAVSHDSRTP